MKIMEKKEVEKKKAVNLQAFIDLRRSADEFARRYYNANSPEQKGVELENFKTALIETHELSEQDAGLLCNYLLNMGAVADAVKNEDIKASKEAAKGDLKGFQLNGRVDQEAYDSAKPEDKVKWRATNAVEDRFRLADYNFRRTANGLGIALDKIILGAESAGLSASLGSQKFARAASEALRGAKNGFVAACQSFSEKTALKVRGFLQDRRMKKNLRFDDHAKAIVTPYYEKYTMDRLNNALNDRAFDEEDRAKLQFLAGKLNTLGGSELDKEIEEKFDMKNNTLRFINMFIDGDRRAKEQYNDFIKFYTSNPRQVKKSEKTRADYAEKKTARNEAFVEKLNEDERRNDMRAKKFASKVYHAAKAKVNAIDMDTTSQKVARDRSNENKTDYNNEYKRIVDRTMAVRPNIIKRGYNRLKAYIWTIPENAQGNEGNPIVQEREMANQDKKKANEMEQGNSKPSEDRGLRAWFSAKRVARAERKAEKAAKQAEIAAQNGNTQRAEQLKEKADKYTTKAHNIQTAHAEKAQKRAERKAEKHKTNESTEKQTANTTTEKQTANAPAEKKQGFWARRAANRAARAEKKAQKALERAAEFEKNGNTQQAEKFKEKANKYTTKAKNINDKQAKKAERRAEKQAKTQNNTTENEATQPTAMTSREERKAARKAYRQAKRDAKKAEKTEIRAAKAERNKSVGNARDVCRNKIRDARQTYKQTIASLRNAFKKSKTESKDTEANTTANTNTNTNTTQSKAKKSLWRRFVDYLSPIPSADKENTQNAQGEADKNKGATKDGGATSEGAKGDKADEAGKPTPKAEGQGATNDAQGEAGNPAPEAQEQGATGATDAGDAAKKDEDKKDESAQETEAKKHATEGKTPADPVVPTEPKKDETETAGATSTETPVESVEEPTGEKVEESTGEKVEEPTEDPEKKLTDEQQAQIRKIVEEAEQDAEKKAETRIRVDSELEKKQAEEAKQGTTPDPVESAEKEPEREMIGPDKDREFNDYKDAQSGLIQQVQIVVKYLGENGDNRELSVIGKGMGHVGALGKQCATYLKVAEELIKRETEATSDKTSTRE